VSGGAPCGCGQAACGCCEGIRVLTPLPTENRPGLDAMAVRIGTHGSFLATMKARLSTHYFGDGPDVIRPFAGLGVRDADASIALLDAFATMADVLTFYQERIVNEGYLGTATQQRSVRDLARLVGYAPRPGVAAGAWLAYTLDANVPEQVTIPAGAQVRTVPGPGELPQMFETSEDLVARSSWNRLGVRQTEPARWKPGALSHELYLAGTATRLKAGDPLLVGLGDAQPDAYRILLVEEDVDAGRTRVELQPWDTPPPAPDVLPPAILVAVRRIRQLHDAPPSGKTAAEIVAMIAWIEEPKPGETPSDADLSAAVFRLLTLRDAIQEKLRPLRNLRQAVRLKSWTLALDKALEILIEAVMRHLEPPAPECSVEALIDKLTIARAVAPASPLRLPGSLAKRFEQAGDAGLTMLAQASPDFAEQLAAGLAGCRAGLEAVPPLRVYALRVRSHLFGHNFPRQRRTRNLNGNIETEDVGEWPIVTADRIPTAGQFASFLKREARDRLDLDGGHDGILPNSWVLADMTGVPDFPDFPATPGAGPGLPGAAVARAGPWRVARIRSVNAGMTRADYGGTGAITRLLIDASRDDQGWIKIAPDVKLIGLVQQEIANRDYEVVRGTTVYAASEALALAPSPMVAPVCDGSSKGPPIELDGLYLGLEPGRFVMVTGERADIENVEGVAGVEPAMIARVVHDVRGVARDHPPAFQIMPGAACRIAPWSQLKAESFSNMAPPEKLAGDTLHTFIWLERPLSYCYRRDSVAIHANLVKASHGETHEETLGSGDGGKANQSFALKHSPLTYVPAPTPAGAADTLQVFVNDIEWKEVGSFVDLPATARAYAVRTDHEGRSSVVFGDGIEGARLPAGTLNVTAIYRSGLGRGGNARAGQIQQLVTRPLGVKEVVNPFRASGGADPETLDQVRRNAPLATAALGRVVAPRDYADFARTFAGIAKADALEISNGSRNVVHVTVAGLDDAPLDSGTELLAALRKAYRDLGDPFQAVQVAPRELRLLVVEADLCIESDRRWEVVATAVREALLDAFGFERRELGQGLASSEILCAIQSVEGVAMVDLNVFGAIPTSAAGRDGVRRPLTPAETESSIKAAVAAGVAGKVDAARARLERGAMLPAELLLLTRDVAATLVLNRTGGQG